MSISRMHFEDLACIAGTFHDEDTRFDITNQLIHFGNKWNPRFNAERFRTAVEDYWAIHHQP